MNERKFYYNKIQFDINFEKFCLISKKFKDIYLNNKKDIYIEDEFSLNSFKSFLNYFNNINIIDIDINILEKICIKWECKNLIKKNLNFFFNKKILFNNNKFLINSYIFENEINNYFNNFINFKFTYEDFQDFLDFLHSRINYKNKFEILLLCKEFKCENLIKLINKKNSFFILNKLNYINENFEFINKKNKLINYKVTNFSLFFIFSVFF